jgi:hypothetical protein
MPVCARTEEPQDEEILDSLRARTRACVCGGVGGGWLHLEPPRCHMPL